MNETIIIARDGVSERELLRVEGGPVGAIVIVYRNGEMTTWRTMKLDGFDNLPSHISALAKAEGLVDPENAKEDII